MCICFRIIGSFPNTYVFTKSLAEIVVKDLGVNLPIAIVRPSMGEQIKLLFLKKMVFTVKLKA
jgi:hypothetical protein